MKKVLLIAIVSLLLLSCNNKKEELAKDAHTEAAMHNDEGLESSEGIRLNNNQKWDVNNEMKPFVVKGEQLVNTYLNTKETDYKKLVVELNYQNEQLIKSCTMDGASHDELHKWLHPHLELTQKLEKQIDSETAVSTVLDLQKSYMQYHEYFN